MKKTLRCKLGLHKWMSHWSAYYQNDKWTTMPLTVGACLGIFGMTSILIANDSGSGLVMLAALTTLIMLPAIGVLMGSFCGVKQDRSCVLCQKHDFTHTVWNAKQKQIKKERKKLERLAEQDYEETKQFLEV